MNDESKDKLREAMDALAGRREMPEGVFIHVDRETTQADWDALDPNSYETTCAECEAVVIGQFGPKGEIDTPCPDCGSTKMKGGIGSPAGAFGLAMRDPAYW